MSAFTEVVEKNERIPFLAFVRKLDKENKTIELSSDSLFLIEVTRRVDMILKIAKRRKTPYEYEKVKKIMERDF